MKANENVRACENENADKDRQLQDANREMDALDSQIEAFRSAGPGLFTFQSTFDRELADLNAKRHNLANKIDRLFSDRCTPDITEQIEALKLKQELDALQDEFDRVNANPYDPLCPSYQS